MKLASVELDGQEALALQALVRARLADVGRMVQGMEEAEGEDLQRHTALKTLRSQTELLEGLLLKLDGAVTEIRR